MFAWRRVAFYSSILKDGCKLWNNQNISTVCACALINSSPPKVTLLAQPVITHTVNVRFKSKGKSKLNQRVSESDSEDVEDDSEEVQDKNTKVMKINVTSLRVDGILKNALGVARNKVETLFYESKIRVNGEKVMKKSMSLREGDEIDIIKGHHQNNPDMLVVARVEVLRATAKEESISLKIRRCKSLVIENYVDRYETKGQ